MKKRDYKAILTIHGLDECTAEEDAKIKVWLKSIIMQIGREKYSKMVRFRLMR